MNTRAIHPSDLAEIALLRQQAVTAIRSTGGAETLSWILRQVRDPHVLDHLPRAASNHPGTLLDISIGRVAIDCSRLLVAAGADPMHPVRADGIRAAHALAATANSMVDETIHAYVELLGGAGADFGAEDARGFTPLHYAIRSGSSTLAKLLIERGVSIDPKLQGDAELEASLIPSRSASLYPHACEALRLVRSLALERALLTGMSTCTEGGPGPTPAITL